MYCTIRERTHFNDRFIPKFNTQVLQDAKLLYKKQRKSTQIRKCLSNRITEQCLLKK